MYDVMIRIIFVDKGKVSLKKFPMQVFKFKILILNELHGM